jgi:hypothetical protein
MIAKSLRASLHYQSAIELDAAKAVPRLTIGGGRIFGVPSHRDFSVPQSCLPPKAADGRQCRLSETSNPGSSELSILNGSAGRGVTVIWRRDRPTTFSGYGDQVSLELAYNSGEPG